jgi:hypothetical protein
VLRRESRLLVCGAPRVGIAKKKRIESEKGGSSTNARLARGRIALD